MSHRSIDSDFDPRTWEEAEDAGLGLPLKRGALSTANCIVGATLDRRNDQLFVHTTVARHAR